MSYSCTDFTDSILDALKIDVPEESWDSPSDQADLALEEIERLQKAAKKTGRLVEALQWIVAGYLAGESITGPKVAHGIAEARSELTALKKMPGTKFPLKSPVAADSPGAG